MKECKRCGKSKKKNGSYVKIRSCGHCSACCNVIHAIRIQEEGLPPFIQGYTCNYQKDTEKKILKSIKEIEKQRKKGGLKTYNSIDEFKKAMED